MDLEVSDLDLEALAAFNAESLRAYGSGNIKLAKGADGRRRFAIESEMFRLTDEFDGGNPFCGITRIIRKLDNAAVWNSYYHGWLTDEAAKHALSAEVIFNFMREALRHAGPDVLSRGPVMYENDDKSFRYSNTLENGDIKCFFGQEAIYRPKDKKPVYICRYGGGLVNLSEDAGEAL